MQHYRGFIHQRARRHGRHKNIKYLVKAHQDAASCCKDGSVLIPKSSKKVEAVVVTKGKKVAKKGKASASQAF